MDDRVDEEYGSKDFEKDGGAFHATVPAAEDVDDKYGQIENTTTHRGLKARHISMIAIGGAVGTGLIIGSGSALSKSGPVGLLMGYSIMGLVCYMVMISLGEQATFLPHKQGFAGYSSRFFDPALGFSLGYNYLFKYLIVTPNNITAGVVVIQYWDHKKYSPAIWCTIMIAAIFLLNMLGVAVFGEFEFWMSAIKVTVLTGLIILGIVLDLGGGPSHDRIGFRYWKEPGPFSHYGYNTPAGVFLGIFYAFPNALFALIGTELVGVTVGESKNPRREIPKAIRRTFWRILVFYIGGITVVGLLVPSNSKLLAGAIKSSANANASPFVVAITISGIKTLPSIINAAILLFVFSAANSDLYIGSRTLFALAVEGQAPSIFAKVSRRGIPFNALLLCTAFCGLSYCSVATSALTVFKYFVSLISMFGALTWMCILWSHIRFMKALAAQGMSRDDLPYKAPFQPYGAWIALFFTGFIVIFKGYDSFFPKFQPISFVTNYIGLPVFAIAYFGYKLVYKTKIIPPAEVDLVSGIREIDENEAENEALEALANKNSNWFARWWNN
ncbi:dicarboxylic amino acid permease [Phaffia rhodozyma]|uniref:Dicarboxylic amino acid permease n=1 Tax=Phaffia rhodozyma TaxID=264483 RepID=A0A0F7SS15_PHARH|nr:dicarboxylic amino acid permease [Phaffia rhodozyma]CED85047.1 dicarboxylic amino acid permease [Phaffia rhodozyma]